MWWGSGQDPGGSEGEGPSKDPPPNQELQDLQDQFESQKLLIAQLKEMLKKTEHSSSVSKEKVEEYASALSKMNARAKRGKLRKTEGAKVDDDSGTKQDIPKETFKKSTSLATPASEKVNLLRQQLEENRLKMAQRDKNQKGIEEMVNQLKAQLDDSQIIISQSTVVVPKTDLASLPVSYTELTKEDLIMHLQNRDKQIEESNTKIQELQANVLDLQENLKEKDSVIDARTKAITLLSENLSKKGKNTLDMLDETKEQMREMQENFVTLETQMKEENAKLKLDLDKKCKEIETLIATNEKLIEEKSSLEYSNIDLQERLNSTIAELENYKLELSNSEMKTQELETALSELKESEKSEHSASSSPQRTLKKSKSSRKSKQKSPEKPVESEHLTRISELELQVEELKSELEKSKIAPKKSDEDNPVVKDLKSQLDTMNKNLIKTKAQYKAKLKDLQKKATPGELNEKVLGLEADNVKLEQRIAELEEEKGNLQLKLVDVDGSSKDKELIADLENRIEEQKMEIENHIRIITILETQITEKSNEISSLRNELANLTHIENAQVCSEITSVQLEEQLDKQAQIKKELEDRCEVMKKEKDELLEKIEELNKEKQEMNAKLVNYMQENMELIDRLEKLSAEKVSSAESIEIVESLTQQEKIEMEAYQKNLEFTSDKEHIEMEPTSELNESVSKLTEDSSELLERIELFTVERREVMEKMDVLLSEKEHLLEKLNKLENEKIEFVKKYDNLCTEKENLIQQLQSLPRQSPSDVIDGIRMDSSSSNALVDEYKILVENQKVEIEQLKSELLRISEENAQIPFKNENLTQLSIEKEGLEIIVASLNEQFYVLHKEYESFLKENKRLREDLKQKSETVYEKGSGDQDIRMLQQKLVDYETKIKEDAEELKFLHDTVEDNKNELISSADYISTLTSDLSAKHSELLSCRTEIDQLNSIIQQQNVEIEHKTIDCQGHIETIDLLSAQLQELKAAMTDNFNELQRYEELDNRIAEANELLDMKDTEINQLRKDRQEFENKIITLQDELKHKDESFKVACQELKDKCMALESKIQVNTGSIEETKAPFEAKIQELEKECKNLEAKHKEHVEKMKKIAANLKKKQAACQELEAKLKETNEKWELEKSEKEKMSESFMGQLQEKDALLIQLRGEMDQKNTDLQKLQDYENEIQQLNSQLEMLQGSSEAQNNVLQELEDLRNNYTTTKNALEAKIQEKDMYIESVEQENHSIKERIAKLSEGLFHVEERRRSLENFVSELGAELEAKSIAVEEVSLSENILEERLSALMQHDKSIENKLKEMTSTNQVLNENVQELSNQNTLLQGKLSELEVRLKEKENECEKMFNLESDSIQLREVISSLEHDMKKLHSDYEKKLFEKTTEIEALEQEMNQQVQEVEDQRKMALNKCETLEYKLQEYINQEKMLLNDLEVVKDQFRQLSDENSNNLLIIEQLKNQKATENNPNMQSEIVRLQNLLAERDHDIQNYQRQNMQLQMSSNSMEPFGFEPKNESEDAALLKQIHDLTNELKVYQQKISELEETNKTLQAQIEDYNNGIVELQEELSQHKDMVRKTAEDNVNDILSTAQQIVETKTQGIDNQLLQQAPIVEESLQRATVEHLQATAFESQGPTREEELLKKIKTLEFMLFNIEKEKDDAIAQCQCLSNELTRLVHEREGLMGHKKETHERTVDMGQVEGQIISSSDTLDGERSVRSSEFPPVNVDLFSNPTGAPVEESLIQPKSAYICFADDKKDQGEASGWGVEDDILSASIEGLIVQEKDIPISPAEKKQFHQLEFGEVHIPKPCPDKKEPAKEKPVDPKSAYLCYPDDANVVQDAFGSEEDGWGWNTEEVKLEAKHQQTLQMAAPPQEDNLRQRIEELETEKAKLTEDLKAATQKTAKLVRKLKELKAKNDSLTNQLQKSSGDFDVLDMAIQDELNSQIKVLETKLKEISEEKHKDKLEKENLLKRIDTLTAANERMIENKEKQDNQIQMLQFNNRQLNSKLEQLEWGSESPHKEAPKPQTETTVPKAISSKEEGVLNKKIEELNNVITELTMDNEELQSLLEEQRKLRHEAERALATKPIQDANNKTETEYLQLQEERDHLHQKQNDLIERTKNMKTIEEYNVLLQERDQINQQLFDLNIMIQNMKSVEEYNFLLQERDQILTQNQYLLQELEVVKGSQETRRPDSDFETLQMENEAIQKRLEEIVNENEVLNQKVAQFVRLNDENLCPRLQGIQDKVNAIVLQKDDALAQQGANLFSLTEENKKLKDELANFEGKLKENKESFDIKVNQIQEQLNFLETKNLDLENLVSEKQNMIIDLNRLIEKLSGEKEVLEIKLREISGALCTENVDQLESLGDKLETIVKEIQNKNKEVAELNEVLNTERLEFEKKFTASIEQLAQEWAERVEQRGFDVAESWKLHVETREMEFSQLQQSLRLELNDIFTKNESLIAENNELQKKVELLFQEKQATASDNQLEALQNVLSERQSEILTLSQQLQEVSAQLEVKNTEILSLQSAVETMQKQNYELVESNKAFEHQNKVLETENKELKRFSKQNEELTTQLKLENQEIEILKQTSEGLRQEVNRLRDELHNEKTRFSETDNRFIELQSDINSQQVKIKEIVHLFGEQLSESFESSYDELLYIEEKINHLIQNLHDLRIVKDQLSNEKVALEEAYTQMSSSVTNNQSSNEKLISELTDLRETVRKLEIDLDESTQARNYDLIQMNNQTKEVEARYEEQLKVKIAEIENLRSQMQEYSKEESERLNLQYELQMKNSEINNLHLEIESLQSHNKEALSKEEHEKANLAQKIQEKENEIQNLQMDIDLLKMQNQESLSKVESEKINFEQQLQSKIDEIDSLKQEIEQLTTYTNENSNMQSELQKKVAEVTNLHMEIELLQNQNQEQLSKQEIEKSNLQILVDEKMALINELQVKITGLESRLHEESIQIDELKYQLDQQIQETNSVKEELNKKSEEYNHVCEEFENVISQRQILKTPEKHVHFREPIAETKVAQAEGSPKPSEETLEPATRAELDLALYMLHQRDVRCEELTVELMQLLEERDTLQLRLSNAIRINEELRSKVSPKKGEGSLKEELNTPKVVQSTGAVPKSKSSDILLKATGTELATEAMESVGEEKMAVKQDLDTKLSELRSVGYNRDKTLKDDQEIRYLQQMSIMQQHRDLASRLPPEAAAKLVDASYTLSRDVQSPSKVLLNWLWGKSTPKVNDV